MLEKILRKLRLQNFVSAATFKNISTLMTGTVISAIIPILSAPLMSRIFTTADYGVLGIYMSISGLIGVIAFSHYPQAIMLPKENGDAKQVFWFSMYVNGAVSVLTLLILLALSFSTSFIENSAIKWWYFMVPLSVFLNGINTAMLLWANRVQQYKTLASNRVIQALFTVFVQLTLGLLIRNEAGLMAGLLTGQLLSVILLMRNFLGNKEFNIGRPATGHFKAIAIQYKTILIYSTPSEFINNLINQTPIFLLQKFGGITYVGSYNFTQRFLGLPQQFLSSAIVDVFKQKASSIYNEQGNCRELFVKTFKALTVIGIIPFGFLMLFAPPVFALVFGEQWREAGVFAQFLSIMFMFRFVVSPLSYMYIVAGKLKEDFVLHILFLVLTTAAFYVGNLFFAEKKYLILLYSLAYSSIYVVYLLRSYQFSKGQASHKS